MLTTTTASDELIQLRGGFMLRASVLIAALDLETRGFTMRADPDGRLVVAPGSKLTDADRRFLADHKAALLSIVAYCATTTPC